MRIWKPLEEQLEPVHQGMYERAKKNLEDHIYEAHSLEEAKELQEKNGGFIKTTCSGSQECELKMKEVAGMSSRCIPFKQEHLGDIWCLLRQACKQDDLSKYCVLSSLYRGRPIVARFLIGSVKHFPIFSVYRGERQKEVPSWSTERSWSRIFTRSEQAIRGDGGQIRGLLLPALL